MSFINLKTGETYRVTHYRRKEDGTWHWTEEYITAGVMDQAKAQVLEHAPEDEA